MALSQGLTLGPMPADSSIVVGLGMAACVGAAILMLAVDVPMYLTRWRHARSSGVRVLSMTEGLRDALQRRRVAHRWCDWRPEVPWMSLYFTVGVWLSLCFRLRVNPTRIVASAASSKPAAIASTGG